MLEGASIGRLHFHTELKDLQVQREKVIIVIGKMQQEKETENVVIYPTMHFLGKN